MAKSTLSFDMDGEEEDEESVKGESKRVSPNGEGRDTPPVKKAKLSKNPNVDTSFLPDREREEAERKERERLRLEWLETQERIKAEEIEVVYSYWDGSGHRKSVMVSSLPSYVHVHELSHRSSARRVTPSPRSSRKRVNSSPSCEE